MKLLTVSCIPFALLIVACSTSHDQSYFPKLAEAQYSISVLTDLGGIINGKVVIRFEGTETINNKTYTKQTMATSGIPGLETVTIYSRLTPDGLYSINAAHKDIEYLSYPLPLRVGATWTSKMPAGEEHCHIDSTQTETFFDKTHNDCVKVSRTSDTYTETDYLVRNIGIVKSILNFKQGNTIEMNIEKYR